MPRCIALFFLLALGQVFLLLNHRDALGFFNLQRNTAVLEVEIKRLEENKKLKQAAEDAGNYKKRISELEAKVESLEGELDKMRKALKEAQGKEKTKGQAVKRRAKPPRGQDSRTCQEIRAHKKEEFDFAYYKACSVDLWESSDEYLWDHFSRHGCHERSRKYRWMTCAEATRTFPKNKFNATYYKLHSADLQQLSGGALWDHFIQHGCWEERKRQWILPVDQFGNCCEHIIQTHRDRSHLVLDLVHYKGAHPQLENVSDGDLLHHFTHVGCPGKWKHAWRSLLHPYGYSTLCKKQYEIFESKEADDLWIGSVGSPAELVGSVTLVVVHCDKPMTWLWKLFEGFALNEIIIYTKCGNPVGQLPSNAQVIVSPNVGRCDHGYLHYMAHMNASSFPKDVVLFMKDNDYDYSRQGFARSIPDLLQIALVRGFACGIQPDQPSKGDLHGYPPFKASYYAAYEMWRKFGITKHQRVKRDRNDVFPSNYSNLAGFADALKIPIAGPYVPVCYGGFFAATKVQIAMRPKSFWAAMEKSLSRGNNIEEGHYVERSWAGILSKPLTSEENDLLGRKYQCIFCGDPYSYPRCGVLGYLK